MHETDRRVIYTKKLLRESLMALMEEKPVGRISVTELCKGAGVNRGTFYSHYRQPEDVLTNIEEELFSDIKEILASQGDMADIHRAIVKALFSNRDACRLLISKNGDPTCMERILEISMDYFKANTLPVLEKSENEARYLHSFLFSGTVAVLRDWLAEGAVKSPDEIADIITDIQKNIIK